MTAKRKIIGRVVYGEALEDSQIYWTCPARGCKAIHYFNFIFQHSSGAKAIYQKECDECSVEYIAVQISVQGSTALLIASEKPEEKDARDSTE